MKYVVWIHGSNGSGKTTQNRMLIESLTDKGEQGIPVTNKEGEKPFMYTLYKNGGLAVLGKMGENQCTGLDAVYGKLGADGVTLSLKKALANEDVNFIIVDCIFGTISWYRKWLEAGLRKEFILIVVHLELTLWENFNRIAQRREKAKGKRGNESGLNWWEIPLPDTVYKNVGSKNRETRNIYLKLIGQHPNKGQNCVPTADYWLQLKAMWKKEQIHKMILNKLKYVLFKHDG